MQSFRLIANFIIAFIFFLGAWAVWSPNVGLDLSKADQLKEKIVKLDLAAVLTRRSFRENAFVLRLNNYDYPFRVYRPLPKYAYLVDNLQVGDSIKIYFRKWTSEDFVSDIFQIEKNGQILLDYKLYNRKYIYLSFFLIATGAIVLVYSFYQLSPTKNSR